MRRISRISVIALFAIVVSVLEAKADDWIRFDRPWTYAELRQAIAYCRVQPQVNPDIRLFIDMLNGQNIENCMYALGWVGLARR